MSKGFLLDTNVFNHVIEGKINFKDLSLLSPIFVSHVQLTEIMQCKNANKREHLLNLFKTLPSSMIPSETALAGIMQVGHGSVGKGIIYKKILKFLNNKQKRKNNAHVYDALLGEVAIKNSLILITNDFAFSFIVKSLGGRVKNLLN